MEFKGTKGKWYLQEYTDAYTNIVRCDNGVHQSLWIASTGQNTRKEVRYDALLISKAPEMLQLINAINNSLCGLLLGDNLTDEELRAASENLLPTIQSDCAKLIQSATELK